MDLFAKANSPTNLIFPSRNVPDSNIGDGVAPVWPARAPLVAKIAQLNTNRGSLRRMDGDGNADLTGSLTNVRCDLYLHQFFAGRGEITTKDEKER